MNKIIAELLTQTSVTNSPAILQLVLILERHNYTSDNNGGGLYEADLSPQMLELTLTADEQIEIVDAISQQIASGFGTRSELFWVLGKAPTVALVPLIGLLEAHAQTFDEETAYQALIALDNCLSSNSEGNLHPDILRVVDKAALKSSIQQLSALNISDPNHYAYSRLDKLAQNILNRL